jgi:hypothetical protein
LDRTLAWERAISLSSPDGQNYGRNTAPPSILHSNKESRAEGLKYYSLVFDASLTDGQVSGVPGFPTIYINWRCDEPYVRIFNFRFNFVREFRTRCETNKLRAITITEAHTNGNTGEDWMFIPQSSSLEELTIATDSELGGLLWPRTSPSSDIPSHHDASYHKRFGLQWLHYLNKGMHLPRQCDFKSSTFETLKVQDLEGRERLVKRFMVTYKFYDTAKSLEELSE